MPIRRRHLILSEIDSPSDFVATTFDGSLVVLNWNKSGKNAVSFEIEASSPDDQNWNTIITTPVGVFTYDDNV